MTRRFGRRGEHASPRAVGRDLEFRGDRTSTARVRSRRRIAPGVELGIFRRPSRARIGRRRRAERRPGRPHQAHGVGGGQAGPILSVAGVDAGEASHARRGVDVEGRGKAHHPAGMVQDVLAVDRHDGDAEAIASARAEIVLGRYPPRPTKRRADASLDDPAALAPAKLDQRSQIAAHGRGCRRRCSRRRCLRGRRWRAPGAIPGVSAPQRFHGQ